MSRAQLVALLQWRTGEVVVVRALEEPLGAAIAAHGSSHAATEAEYGAVLRFDTEEERVRSRHKLSIHRGVEIGRLVLGSQPPKGSCSV